MEIKVILPADEIPILSDVTKINGQKIYQLTDKIRIFTPKEETQELKSKDGTRFLVNDSSVNVVDGKTELVWVTNVCDLYSYLEELVEGTPQ